MSKAKTTKPAKRRTLEQDEVLVRNEATGRMNKYVREDEQTGKEIAVVEQPTLDVIEGEVVPAGEFNDTQQAKLDRHIATARHEFVGMIEHFHASVVRIGKAVCDAKSLAGQMRVPFESLFGEGGDFSDPKQFPFSQAWGNKFARVYKSKICDSTIARLLPPDVNILDTLAGVADDKRLSVANEYRYLRESRKDLKPQDAAKLAKKLHGGDPSKMARAPKQKKGGGHYFDPSAFRSMDDLARKLVDGLDADDASVLQGEIVKLLDDEPVKKSTKKKLAPKAAPEGDLDVEPITRAFVADHALTSIQISEAIGVLKQIIEERK